jgi:hypothetical protein
MGDRAARPKPPKTPKPRKTPKTPKTPKPLKLLKTWHWVALCAVMVLVTGAGVVLTRPSLLGFGDDQNAEVTPASTSGGATTTSATASTTAPAYSGASLPLPLRAAFYEAGYPQAWSAGAAQVPLTFQPSAGRYDGGSAAVVDRHIADLQYAGMQAGIVAWAGPGTPSDQRLPLLLQRAAAKKFHWAVGYQREAADDPSAVEITADLARLAAVTADPSYLHVAGRAVLFVDTAATDGCATLDRWGGVDLSAFYLVSKVVNGYAGCTRQPQGWYADDPATSRDLQPGRSGVVSPGYAASGQPTRLARDPKRFRADVTSLAASKAPLQLINSYNDWTRGTTVESAAQWASRSGRGAYLDVLHEVFVLGRSGPAPTTTGPKPTGSSSPRTVTVAAVGDLACDPDDPNWNNSAGTSSNCHERKVAELVGQVHPAAFLPLGDVQYENGSSSAFAKSYHPWFGRYLSISHPAVGNHEYRVSGARGYFDYFGSRAGEPGKGYYSFDLGAWHLIALNSECGEVSCAKGSTQETWLRQDLAAHRDKCVLAYWHQARWSNGAEHGDTSTVAPFVQALYEAHAEVILSGHDHDYERFAPRAPSGSIDRAAGIRQFVVGGGGKNLKPVSPSSATEAYTDSAYGLLSLTLSPGSYSWRFLPEAGKSFTDSGTTACH